MGVYCTRVKREERKDDSSKNMHPSSKGGGDAPLSNFRWGDLLMIVILSQFTKIKFIHGSQSGRLFHDLGSLLVHLNEGRAFSKP